MRRRTPDGCGRSVPSGREREASVDDDCLATEHRGVNGAEKGNGACNVVRLDEPSRRRALDGAKHLLAKQKDDGSWWTGALPKAGEMDVTADTCFAILFLTRATPALTATEGGKKK